MEKAKKDKTEYAIEVTDLDKSFWIPDEKVTSLKSYFLNPLNLFRQKGKRFDALSDVSFKIKKGEFVGVIGRNGSGKSTLLKTLAGIYAPDKGEIKINGKLVPFLELGVGFNPDLSARENVYLNGAILGMSRKYLEGKFDEIIDFAEIREFVDTPVKNFSSGMMVRLAFAIAIQSDADIFLLDEVFGVGDANFRLKSYQKFLEFKKQNKTIILVSHSLEDIQSNASRVFYMKNGRLAMDGKSVDVVNQYKMDNLGTVDENIEEAEKQLTNDIISRVLFLDGENNQIENNTVQTGELLKISVRYDLPKTLEGVKVGIAIYNEQDQVVYGTNNEKRGVIINKKQSKSNEVSFIFETLNLLEGQYRVSIAVATTTKGLLAQHDRTYQFRVLQHRNNKDYGIIKLDPVVSIGSI